MTTRAAALEDLQRKILAATARRDASLVYPVFPPWTGRVAAAPPEITPEEWADATSGRAITDEAQAFRMVAKLAASKRCFVIPLPTPGREPDILAVTREMARKQS